VDIRFARPDEARVLIDLLGRQHGRLYPQGKFYDEGFVAEAIAREELHFALAEAGNGETVGMICAGVQSAPIPALVFSLLTVLPSYRGHGLGRRMQDFLDARLPLARYPYACMYCLTLNTASQADALSRGYTPTGLLPNRYFFDPAAANLAGETVPLKRSHLLMCKAFARRDAGVLFCPAELADFTAAVFGALGVGFTLAPPGARPAAAETEAEAEATVFRAVRNEEHRLSEIWIERGGGDLPQLLRRWDDAPGQTCSIRLSMAHPSCPAACAALYRQGYICTGLTPLAASGAYLLFYRSPSAPLDRGGLALHPAFLALWEKIKDAD
jgi:GNAT superfamily N-acetyltransferase